jgi:hypothetical protein
MHRGLLPTVRRLGRVACLGLRPRGKCAKWAKMGRCAGCGSVHELNAIHG